MKKLLTLAIIIVSILGLGLAEKSQAKEPIPRFEVMGTRTIPAGESGQFHVRVQFGESSFDFPSERIIWRVLSKTDSASFDQETPGQLNVATDSEEKEVSLAAVVQWNEKKNYRVRFSATVVPAAMSSLSASGAPLILAATPTLRSVTITGPKTVGEGKTAQYVATATYSDGSRVDVTSNTGTIWSISASYGSITKTGLFTANQVLGNASLTVRARFGTLTGSLVITIVNNPSTLVRVYFPSYNATSTKVRTNVYFYLATEWSDGSTVLVQDSGITYWSASPTYLTFPYPAGPSHSIGVASVVGTCTVTGNFKYLGMNHPATILFTVLP